MYKETIRTLHVVNIVFQAIFTLLWQIGIAVLASWLLTEKAGLPRWIYAPIVTLGAISGIWTMMRFIIKASENLERLEREHKESEKNSKANREKEAGNE